MRWLREVATEVASNYLEKMSAGENGYMVKKR
jgi:hypothetical protein